MGIHQVGGYGEGRWGDTEGGGGEGVDSVCMTAMTARSSGSVHSDDGRDATYVYDVCGVVM